MKLNVLYALFVICLLCIRSCDLVEQDRCLDQGGRWLNDLHQCGLKKAGKNDAYSCV